MKRYLLWAGLLIVLCTFSCALISYNLFATPHSPPQPVVVKVEQGDNLTKVGHKLETAGVVRYALLLKIIARWKHQENRIQVGSYRFSNPATPIQVLDRLISGDVEKASLTIPEGFTLEQIIQRIARKKFGRKDKLLQLAYDKKFIASLNVSADSLEGYLFPETYLFAPGIDERSLLKMLVTQFFSRITPELKQQATRVGLSLHQLVTLASIIEKETGSVEEMPLISSVFHNRLKRRIPLQTDPTVIYGIKNFDGNITRKHLKTPTPYNTYMIKGLPPGPIASPGLAALQAAAQPARTKYFYFVAKGDGTHHFSTTLREHNGAVRRYQLRRR